LPTRLATAFEEASFIENEHPIWSGEVVDHKGPQFIPHGLGIPAGAIEEALDAVGAGFQQRFRQLPRVLAVEAVEEEPRSKRHTRCWVSTR
jgi:hypothetical protein